VRLLDLPGTAAGTAPAGVPPKPTTDTFVQWDYALRLPIYANGNSANGRILKFNWRRRQRLVRAEKSICYMKSAEFGRRFRHRNSNLSRKPSRRSRGRTLAIGQNRYLAGLEVVPRNRPSFSAPKAKIIGFQL
jgi:hypothetical protein